MGGDHYSDSIIEECISGPLHSDGMWSFTDLLGAGAVWV